MKKNDYILTTSLPINWDKHPYWIASELIDAYGNELVFEFSKYKYIPQSFEDHRTIFHVKSADMCPDYVETIIDSLRPDEDLAFHSRVNIDGVMAHIPMIDLSASSSAKAIRNFLEILPNNVLERLKIYDSGRSFHAYSSILIEDKEFAPFLGRLLLANKPQEPALVDSRWIGHRLMAGYLSLRWSCNTTRYKQYPALIS